MKKFAIFAAFVGALYAAFEAGEFYNYNKHVQLRATLLRWVNIMSRDATEKTLVDLMQDKDFNKYMLEYLTSES